MEPLIGTRPGETKPKIGALLVGAGIGATLMYFLDPRLGAHRRGLARDRANRIANRSVWRAEKSGRNIRNHLQGAIVETLKWFRGEPPVSDQKLADRIRSKIGRVLEHPSAVEIEVSKGHVLARGQLAADSATRVLNRIRRIRGVEEVEDKIERVV